MLRPEDLADRLGVSRTTLWRWQRDGVLPRSRQFGPNTVGWPEVEIRAWMETRPSSDDAEPE